MWLKIIEMYPPTVLGLEAWDQGISRTALSLKALEENAFHAFLWCCQPSLACLGYLCLHGHWAIFPLCVCIFTRILFSLCLFVSLSSYNRASQAALVVKNPPAHAGDVRDVGSISGLGRSPGGGHGNPLQYSCLENPMDRGAWKATIHRVAMSQTRPKRLSMHALHNIIFFLL